MTNAEKYLKDATDIDKFAIELTKQISRWDDLSYYSSGIEQDIIEFLNKSTKPALTEDERVILKNVGTDYQRIERDDECLWVRGVDKDGFMATCYFKCFDHLFQFIKERRRIRDSRTSFW